MRKRRHVVVPRERLWRVIEGAMKEQLAYMPAWLMDRAAHVDQWLRAAGRSNWNLDHIGVTINWRSRRAIVWIHTNGRHVPTALTSLPITRALLQARREYTLYVKHARESGVSFVSEDMLEEEDSYETANRQAS